MKQTTDLAVEITPELRLTAPEPIDLTPGQALHLAERLTIAAMTRQAALMPARRNRRLRGRSLLGVVL